MEEKTPKIKQELTDEFIAEYKALCEKYGLAINVTPVWKQSLDNGDWRMTLQTNLQKLQK
jgi:hypothetical protein